MSATDLTSLKCTKIAPFRKKDLVTEYLLPELIPLMGLSTKRFPLDNGRCTITFWKPKYHHLTCGQTDIKTTVPNSKNGVTLKLGGKQDREFGIKQLSPQKDNAHTRTELTSSVHRLTSGHTSV